MKYETYAYLRDCLDAELIKLDKEFRISCSFIPTEKFNPRKESGLDKAYRIFLEKVAKINEIKADLHKSAAAAYEKHPSPEMRKFWGFKK